MTQDRRERKRSRAQRRRPRRERGPGKPPEHAEFQPAQLHHLDEFALGTMHPGDIILLAEAESLRSAVESIFFAILACPKCGTLGLITSSQYFGAEPVICGSKLCSCRFRIDNKTRLVYLPVV